MHPPSPGFQSCSDLQQKAGCLYTAQPQLQLEYIVGSRAEEGVGWESQILIPNCHTSTAPDKAFQTNHVYEDEELPAKDIYGQPLLGQAVLAFGDKC